MLNTQLHSVSDLKAGLYDALDFCSTKDAAKLLGISHRTVQLWVEKNVLQAWKTAGGHRRIAMSSVNTLVEQRSSAIQGQFIEEREQPCTRVLLVDEDKTSLHLFEQEIASWNLPLKLRKATNGYEALIRIGEARPDILISDVTMSGSVALANAVGPVG